MNYQEFLDAVVDCVKKIVGREADVFIHHVTKNNGVVLDGIVIMMRNSSFSPTIYLNGYYSMYLSGCDIEQIAGKVYRLYEANAGAVTIPEDFFLDFDKLKDNVAFRLISYERNRRLLERIPHRRFKDLAIVYFVVVDSIENGRGTITIYNNHLELWEIAEELLYRLAMKNTPRLYEAEIKPMNKVISEMILKEGEGMDVDALIAHVERMNEQFPMYVLSNSYRSYGASCMLYEGLLAKFAAHIEADLYIIPSSVHELILIPIEGEVTEEGLEEMIRSVNSTELSREEVLSDSVYKFTRRNGFE